MLTALIVTTSIAQLLVSLFVLLRGKRSLTNIFFFFIGIASLGWAITNYLTVALLDSPELIYIVRTILFFVVLQNAAFYMFAHTFPESSWKNSKRSLVVYCIFTLAAALATLSPYVFTVVQIRDGLPITQAGPAILIFIAHAAFSISLAFRSLIKKLHKSAGVQRIQLQVLLFASVLVWIIVPITNFMITPLLKTTLFVVISPIYTLAFASIIAYAIVAQKLFDIRAVVARSVAYVLSLGFIGLIYGAIIYIVSSVFSFNQQSISVERAIYVALALVTAILYPSVKKFFSKVTTRIFYQDAYDPQEFLDRLNKILVSRIDLEPMLKDVAKLIEKDIKADYCVFTIRASTYYPVRTVGTKNNHFSAEDIGNLHRLTPKINDTVLITDELGETQNDLKAVLAKNSISVLARLASTDKSDAIGTGYLALGPKKSGNIYTQQDENIIRITANALVIAIENASKFEEIQKFNETLQGKIETATRQLRHTNEKLKVLDEAKDDFISLASHQLRTPLTIIKGYTSMLLEGDAGDPLNPTEKKILTQTFISAKNMARLIDDLLNASRLKTGKFVIETKQCNLAEMIGEEIGQLTETATGRGLQLVFKKPSNFPTLLLDETKTRQVVMNFIDNAIYYTPSGGKIIVELQETAHDVVFTVTDNGIGVPKAAQHNLFKKMYRADNAKKVRPDGTGLGLFMAKKVVELQGGVLNFSSKEGHGSVFGFTFGKANSNSKSKKPA